KFVKHRPAADFRRVPWREFVILSRSVIDIGVIVWRLRIDANLNVAEGVYRDLSWEGTQVSITCQPPAFSIARAAGRPLRSRLKPTDHGHPNLESFTSPLCFGLDLRMRFGQSTPTRVGPTA